MIQNKWYCAFICAYFYYTSQFCVNKLNKENIFNIVQGESKKQKEQSFSLKNERSSTTRGEKSFFILDI